MKIFQPQWVNHEDKPIFSLDIHPDGTRFATGGQGNDCGRVVIWNMKPVKSEQHELDAAVPKMLCQMDNHLGCVNCVRWSLNGQMLASGGDDKIIMIWKKSKGATSSFGGFAKNHENWRCVHTLRGHEGDVLDLAWSPGDRWLASSSVDNSVFVWDMASGQSAPTVMSILKGHTGLVKGVAWDPVGKYVASQSDDRSVKIWKTADWTCESTITEPFVECGGTTHILRLSWSPDGQYLVSAHAMNGGGPTAQIIDREGWRCDKDFVGHRKAVTCVRFHNSIMMRTAPKTSKTQQYCCLAVGSRDKSLSVWMTALQRPLVVIYDLFQDSILDLSWSTDGYILMACSGDGTVVFIQFSEEDIGTPLSENEKNSLYQRMYGKSMSEMNVSSDKDFIIENAELLNTSQDGSNKQEASKPIPTFLTPDVKMNDDFVRSSCLKMAPDRVQVEPKPAQQNNATPAVSSPLKQAIHKQIETRTKDGKRRITPMFIPLTQDNETPSNEQQSGQTMNATQIQSSSRISTSIIMEKIQDVLAERIDGEKQSQQVQGVQQKMDSRLSTMTPNEPPAKTGSNLSTTNPVETSSSGQVQKSAQIGRHLLISGKSEAFHTGVTRFIGPYRLLVANNFLKLTSNCIHRVSCFNQPQLGQSQGDEKQAIWHCVTGSPICNFNACPQYVIVACLDGTIRVLDIKMGTPILPVITLSTAVVQSAFNLTDQRDLVGVVTETGLTRIWDVKMAKVELSVTCSDLLRVTTNAGGVQTTSILMLTITDNGMPFIVLGNGTSYCYSLSLDSWLVLNGKDLLQQRSLLKYAPTTMLNPNMIIPKDMKRYPLTSIQTTVLSMFPAGAVASSSHGNNLREWEQLSQLAFIENQIKLCEAIHSPDELKYWYSSLGYHLATTGTETRLRLLLDDLLGPLYLTPSDQAKREILGIKKLDLLDSVLGHIKTQGQWQRIYMEYGEQLKELRKSCAIAKMDVN